jgi:hypothetical protein
LIDKNVARSLLRNIGEASKLIHLEPVAMKLDSREGMLRSMGMSNSADAVSNYRRDVMGQYRKGLAKIDEAWIEELKLKFGVEKVDRYKGYLDLMTNAIYPNLVGLNPAGWVRNLTQPITKTIPEMGFWDIPRVMKAYGRALKTLSTDRDRLLREGIISDGTTRTLTEMPLSATSSQNKLMRGANWWNEKIAMRIFNKTDEINRVVTAELASDLSKDILEGGTEAGLKAIRHFPPALKARALRAIRGFDNDPEGLERAVRNHFEVQTQLAYGKVGNSEFVRDNGRLFSMMTKWPVAVGSDIATLGWKGGPKKELLQNNRKAIARFGQKYMGPYLLAVLASNAIKPEEGEETNPFAELMLGRKYGANFTPIESVMGLNMTSPLISGLLGSATGVKEMAEAGIGDMLGADDAQTKQQMRRGAKAISGGVGQFLPVVGGVWKTWDRIGRLWDTSTPVNLLLPEEYEYEEE